nr:immunoglobulin heavy chain junction region [Macaca mulatta]MPN72598.1 immunoglobulin heavy chain junction region [Macaca mulatta]MPN72617.1 immunoglobulin heavy chain junction region [Macaca mulatta]MPN75799.1 immunoglobulin heavy chain junction region [Macaca mulatta]MPN76102.1 immunoglobulin heavy chain junction region [Macaca mulatta]
CATLGGSYLLPTGWFHVW